ncbi:hypothetical protein RQP46_004553 [Phenoliferia psychrophenolica]
MMHKTVQLGDLTLPSPGYGAMGLSQFYGKQDEDVSEETLRKAIELVRPDRRSSACGPPTDQLRSVLAEGDNRSKVFVITKWGNLSGVNEKGENVHRGVDGSEEYAAKAIDLSIERLGSPPDAWICHRMDMKIPIEETVQAMEDARKAGKFSVLNLPVQCSANTLRSASKVAKIHFVEMEYSPWTLDIEENGVLAAAKELGVIVLAYAPLGRGFLTGRIKSPADLVEGDVRHSLPRFQPGNFERNIKMVQELELIAQAKDCTAGQLALAWLMAQGDNILPIPGTKSVKYLTENWASNNVELADADVQAIRKVVEGDLDTYAYLFYEQRPGSTGRYPKPSFSSNPSYSSNRSANSTTRASQLSLSEGLTSPYDSVTKSFAFLDDDDDDGGTPLKDRLAEARRQIDPSLLWVVGNVDADDFMHEIDPEVEKYLDKQFNFDRNRVIDTTMLVGLVLLIVGLFAGWPISNYVIRGGFPMGRLDMSGNEVPGLVPNTTIPSLIDADTPTSVYSRKGFDGSDFELVFSDEFNRPGRTFWPGDDPFWEAVDLWYSGTSDLEWYDPDAITTRGGNLELELSHFTGGYIEVNLSLPGTADAQGFWSAAWTMGNLARAGYGSSNDGDEHPGPNVRTGRGAPEIDIIEATIDPSGRMGAASQSMQVAPMDAGYKWLNETPYIRVWDTDLSTQNQWHGSIYQESMSLQTTTDNSSYDGNGYTHFGFEYDPGEDGSITWAINGTESWQLNASAMGPNEETETSQRLVAVEPLSIVFNLAISTKSGQTIEWGKIAFPATLRIDYVRVYQKKGQINIGCDPADFPTSKYINDHPLLYDNPQLVTFKQSGYPVPRNSLSAAGYADP